MDTGSLLVGIVGALAVVLLVGLLVAAIWLGVSQGRVGRRKVPGASEEPHWAGRVAALEVKMDSLPGLWEQERKRAEQARDRERYYATKRARRRDIADDDGTEDESIPGGDAPTGDVQGMLPLPEGVGRGSALPEPEHLARARQMGYPWSFLS